MSKLLALCLLGLTAALAVFAVNVYSVEPAYKTLQQSVPLE